MAIGSNHTTPELLDSKSIEFQPKMNQHYKMGVTSGEAVLMVDRRSASPKKQSNNTVGNIDFDNDVKVEKPTGLSKSAITSKKKIKVKSSHNADELFQTTMPYISPSSRPGALKGSNNNNRRAMLNSDLFALNQGGKNLNEESNAMG